jgi:hypothetical protein
MTIRRRKLRNARYKQLRGYIIDALGGRCCKCGFCDRRALQVDHVNGDGYLFKSEMTNPAAMWELVQKDVKEQTGKFQLLCANCNWIKKHDDQDFGIYREVN